MVVLLRCVCSVVYYFLLCTQTSKKKYRHTYIEHEQVNMPLVCALPMCSTKSDHLSVHFLSIEKYLKTHGAEVMEELRSKFFFGAGCCSSTGMKTTTGKTFEAHIMAIIIIMFSVYFFVPQTNFFSLALFSSFLIFVVLFWR